MALHNVPLACILVTIVLFALVDGMNVLVVVGAFTVEESQLAEPTATCPIMPQATREGKHMHGFQDIL